MHGSSSVPQEWLAIIREHGGDIKETMVFRSKRSSAESAPACAREYRHGYSSGDDRRHAPALSQDPSEFDPRKALIAARQARDRCARRVSRPSGAPDRRNEFRRSPSTRWRSAITEPVFGPMIESILWDVDGTMAETERDGHSRPSTKHSRR